MKKYFIPPSIDVLKAKGFRMFCLRRGQYRYPGFARGVSIAIFFVVLCVCVGRAEQIAVEKQAKEILTLPESSEKNFSFSSGFEYSWIKQGGRKINWRMWTNRLTYRRGDRQAPYVEVTNYKRAGLKDYTVDAGYDIRFNNAYGHAELGFGGERSNYVYKFQTALEYGHKFIDNLFWKFRHRYMNYAQNDVFMFSPGLLYYFGKHYLSFDYNASRTESRDTAHCAVVKGNFSVNDKLDVWLGTAVGERLYDIYTLIASKQYGYIFFGGITWHIHKDITFRIGSSYGEERPAFIKRSFEFSLSFKF